MKPALCLVPRDASPPESAVSTCPAVLLTLARLNLEAARDAVLVGSEDWPPEMLAPLVSGVIEAARCLERAAAS